MMFLISVSRGCPCFSYMANRKQGSITRIITNAARLVPVLPLSKKKSGSPTRSAAAKKMIGAGTDYLMVRAKDTEPPEFIGILTKVDIVKSLCAEDSDPDTDTVDKFMSRHMVVANVGDDVEYVMNVMVRHKISHLPVIEGKSIAGVISRNDILAELNVKRDIELQWLSDYSGAIPKATVY